MVQAWKGYRGATELDSKELLEVDNIKETNAVSKCLENLQWNHVSSQLQVFKGFNKPVFSPISLGKSLQNSGDLALRLAEHHRTIDYFK